MKYINKQTQEETVAWKKSDELTCTDAIFEYWKSPHQYSDDITVAENPINPNDNVKKNIQILGIAPINNHIVFLVRFPDADRDKLVKSKDLMQNYPNEVIDFYRSHAVYT